MFAKKLLTLMAVLTIASSLAMAQGNGEPYGGSPSDGGGTTGGNPSQGLVAVAQSS